MRRSHTNRTTILQVGVVAAGLFALLVLLSSGSGGMGAAAGANAASGTQELDAGRVRLLGHMTGRVPESSGLALSEARPDVMWTHNDGGRDPRLHAVALDGTWLGSLTVSGARAEDWEDVARAPCPGASPAAQSCLYVADIGDNDARRSSVRILVLDEPGSVEDETRAPPLATIEFRYPDGPTDAEALAITRGGDALIISKGSEGVARVFRLAAAVFSGGRDTAVVADTVATLPIDVREAEHRITAAAMSPGGGTLAVRSSSEVYLFATDEWTRAPRICSVEGRQEQGEAMDFRDEETLILTSEGAGSPILSLRCP